MPKGIEGFIKGNKEWEKSFMKGIFHRAWLFMEDIVKIQEYEML